MTLLKDSAHFTPAGRRLLAFLGAIRPDPLRVEAERWLLSHKGPQTSATRRVRDELGVTPADWLEAAERMRRTPWKGPIA